MDAWLIKKTKPSNVHTQVESHKDGNDKAGECSTVPEVQENLCEQSRPTIKKISHKNFL